MSRDRVMYDGQCKCVRCALSARLAMADKGSEAEKKKAVALEEVHEDDDFEEFECDGASAPATRARTRALHGRRAGGGQGRTCRGPCALMVESCGIRLAGSHGGGERRPPPRAATPARCTAGRRNV